MSGLNKVIIQGRLGKDPELRFLQNGQAVCKCVVATSEKYTTKDTHETKEITEWHRLTIWGKQGEVANKYLRKGDQALFVGELKTSSFDKDGQKHFATEIVVNELHLLGGNPRRDSEETPSQNNKQSSNTPKPSGNTSSNNMPDDFSEFQNNGGDDDIPF